MKKKKNYEKKKWKKRFFLVLCDDVEEKKNWPGRGMGTGFGGLRPFEPFFDEFWGMGNSL